MEGTGDIVLISEIDGTVGSDGRLHMFAEVLSSFSATTSIPCTSSMQITECTCTCQLLMELTEVETLVTSLLPEGEFGTTPVSVTQNPQISRTPDGSKLFLPGTSLTL